ncbi:MAG: class I tRNA ligase family protein, partial [Paludibacteraceae bacterium]|nr:class I tRNA ligase family protein [Paludibacteraceae bacterium]
HPFMPFITEELYQALKTRDAKDSIMVSLLPKAEDYCEKCLKRMEQTKEIIAGIRNIRAEKGISPREAFSLYYKGEEFNSKNNSIIEKLANIESIAETPASSVEGASQTFMVGTVEITIPLAGNVNVEEEIKKMEDEIKYLEGFLISVNKKLSNEKFVANAKPEVVANERKKQADAESKIAALKANIAKMK